MKISKDDLNKMSDLAKYYYRQDSNPDLNHSQLVAQSWTKAVMHTLAKEVDLEFPQRVISESVFED